MKNWQRTLIRAAFFALLLAGGASNAQTFPELKKLISDQLLYPRECRYTLQATLPSDKADRAKNAEWLMVAEQLHKAGLVRASHVSGKISLDGTEQSLDVIVPSMNLRYETTALNIVLGRWEIDVLKAVKVGMVTVVHGKRRVAKRTRAYGVIIPVLPANEAAKYSDQDVVWEISGTGASPEIVEKLK